MGYAPRRDSIPAEPVATRVGEWIARQPQEFGAAAEALARMAGYEASSVVKLAKYQKKYLSFDQVDRIFCAMGEPVRLWQSHPELAEAYPRACFWADEIYPIGVEETYKERQARIKKADYHRQGYQLRTEEEKARRRARAKARREAMSEEELGKFRQKRNQEAAARRARGDETDAIRARRWRAKKRAEKAA